MKSWIDALFGIGILLVLVGIGFQAQGTAWGQWLILGGLALMVPYFFRRTLHREDTRHLRRRR